MAGKRVGVNEVTRGRILVCFKSMCVQASVYFLLRYLIGCRVFLFPVSTRTLDIFSLKTAANTKAG